MIEPVTIASVTLKNVPLTYASLEQLKKLAKNGLVVAKYIEGSPDGWVVTLTGCRDDLPELACILDRAIGAATNITPPEPLP